MNYKKAVNITLRCLIYIYISSRIFNMCVVPNHIFTIGAIKVLLDFVFIDIFFRWLPPFSDEQINNLGNFLMCANHVFFSYFYAKLCELYKLFKHHKLWQKNLIFLLLTILILPFAMFDFKNFKVFDNFFIDNNSITIYFTMICTILAFY